MNDTTAAFKAAEAEKQHKRAANLYQATALLESSGVTYVAAAKDKNGHKLRIQSVRKYYDFWPESATWRLRGGEVTHRGVYKLLWQLAKDGIKLREAGETK